ncbi:MAG TPA: FAD-dependent oxidoreductase [Acidimicrobiales bacterium]|nr:FAD-dependent oxidoreductase [Acidimicrobiales bacterium]
MTAKEIHVDVVVVGAGIAGVSAAAVLAASPERPAVVVLEREDAPARHTTGRSAAVFTENYGNDVVRALTIASRSFLERPPGGFADVAILTPRGALTIGDEHQRHRLDALAASGRTLVPTIERLDLPATLAHCPALDATRVAGSVWEPDARDIDVDALLQGYLRVLRAAGGRVRTGAALVAAEPVDGGWRATTAAGDRITAGWIVDAAGAWGDETAAACGIEPVGLQPMRRTAFLFDPPAGVAPGDLRGWPLVIDADERYYFKPDSGLLLGSLADETPSSPCDASPEEADVALALDRIVTVLPAARQARRVRRAWAGLRTFAPDRTPVVGVEPDRQFCWVVGQGGYGIQTAPAMAAAAASLVLAGRLPDDLVTMGLSTDVLGPGRFRRAPGGAPTRGRDG